MASITAPADGNIQESSNENVVGEAVSEPAGQLAVTSSNTDVSGASGDVAGAVVAAGGGDDVENITNSLVATSLTCDSHLFVGDGVTFDHDLLKCIPKSILDAITVDLELRRPSPIQLNIIPRALEKQNIIAQAQTGSGKTLAFSVSLLSVIDCKIKQPQALVIAPTRELAVQIETDWITPLSKRMDPRPVCEKAISGVTPQRGHKCRSQVIVGTAGKIKDWSTTAQYLKLASLKILVVDEADHMVSNSFRDDITLLAKKCKDDCQFLFFSATYTEDAKNFCEKLITDRGGSVCKVSVPRDALMVKDIFQVRMNVDLGQKIQVLKAAYKFLEVHQSIVFLDTVEEANQTSRMLTEEGYTVSTIHGRIEAAERDSIMEKFRKTETKFLVTTDLLARGVDVPSVSVVINFTVPRSQADRNAPSLPDPEKYLHRIGRTGRYNRRGFVITFIETEQDKRDLENIEAHYLGDAAFAKGDRLTTEYSSTDDAIEDLKEKVGESDKVQVTLSYA